jgi:peroxiredoxin
MASVDNQANDAPEQAGRPAGRRRDWSGLLRSVVLPLGLLALIVGGLWYWDSRGDEGARDAFGAVELPAGKNATDRGPAPEVGRAGPDFLLETPQGGTLRLSDLQGRPVLLNFWARWCPPCRTEMPELVKAYSRYRDDGLVIVGVDMQEPDDLVLSFAEEFGIEFPLAIDRDGEMKDVWRLGGPIQGLPTSFFIDSTGVVREVFYGPLNEDFLEERLAEILPEASG